MVSFDVQKFSMLVESWFVWFFFFLVFLFLLVMSKKPFHNPRSRKVYFYIFCQESYSFSFYIYVCGLLKRVLNISVID